MNNGFSRESLKEYAAQSRAEFEKTFGELVQIPTVSGQAERKADVRRGAEFALKMLESFGAKAKLYETGGHPMVHGRFDRSPDLPTVTVYNHLDVQPASKKKEPWRTEPFDFVKDGNRYFGRGTTDDKGPAMTALFGARYAVEHGVGANIHFLWELEEEIGSPHFETTISEHASDFATDSVVVSDTVWVSRSRPAQPAGLRGLQGLFFHLETGTTDQHSGTAGGAARNPLTEMAQLISECVDGKTGRVKIPGFYADVVPPNKKELEDLKASGFTVKEFKKDHLYKKLRVEDPMEVMKRIWLMPTFEVHGILGGYQPTPEEGLAVKTIVPAKATAIVSCRLVPNMSPKKVVKLIRDFVKTKNPDVKVSAEHALPAYSGKTTGPYADAIRESMKFAFGREPVFVREGGSIGAVLSMEKVFRTPIFFLGLSLPEHGYHAPNENFDWEQASGGMAAFARYFQNVGSLAR
ncbi:MAG TPA: M20/M25/M40 family metallo-hydrolase [Thermoanaerobaculia bacterium]|nr:M20/M25/M40 family metallo-hydrolase [Thermoanaerobaculia bacterium]